MQNNPGTGNPAPRSPLPRIELPSLVTMAGIPCEVTYAGLAPDLVGVYQINVRTPPNLPSGELELVLTVGGAASRPARIHAADHLPERRR